MRTLVVYYSQARGNTKRIADMIANGTGFDAVRIDTQVPYKAAAKAAGLPLKHSGVKNILQNKKYLGSDSYPAIIDKETFDAAEEERKRREVALGRDCRQTKPLPQAKYYDSFSMPEIPRKYDDPVKQVEFAYGLVRNEVSN